MYMHMTQGELLTLDTPRGGLRITCQRGRVWVTQAGDSRDILLRSGQEIELRLKGRVAITALEESHCLPELLGQRSAPLQIVTRRA